MLHLGYVRLNLTAALLTPAPASEHQIAALMSRSGPSHKIRNNLYKPPTRNINIGKRWITVDADPVRCSETRSYKSSRELISPKTYELAAWRRAVSLLSTTGQSWVRYCYGDSLNFDEQIIICRHVWSAFCDYQTKIGAPRMSKKIEALVQRLVWLAVQEGKVLANRQSRLYGSKKLAALSGVAADVWCKTYQPRWNGLIQVINALDHEALAHAKQKHTQTNFC